LIFHGRILCKARNPKCDQCPLSEDCRYNAQTTTINRNRRDKGGKD
jgi:endonuclease III